MYIQPCYIYYMVYNIYFFIKIAHKIKLEMIGDSLKRHHYEKKPEKNIFKKNEYINSLHMQRKKWHVFCEMTLV